MKKKDKYPRCSGLQYCDHMERVLECKDLITRVLIPCPDGGFYTMYGVETNSGVHVFKFCPWCGESLIPKQISVEPSDTIDYD